jgi:hypothetical protein
MDGGTDVGEWKTFGTAGEKPTVDRLGDEELEKED